MSNCRPDLSRRKSRVCGIFYGLITITLLSSLTCVPQCAFAQNNSNGIVVGPAKLYDERSLENQLESIKSSLTTDYVNPQAVAGNEGVPQGGGMTSSQVSGSLGYNLGKPQDSGSSSDSGGQKSSDKGGSAPISSTFNGNTIALQSPMAVSSEDLLQQQVGLSFEATNLRLLLDHALSDRVLVGADGTAVTRQLAIIGFQISVEPGPTDKYAVAEADITVTDNSHLGCPTIAMMLPQDKTYNVAKVTNDSNAFSLGAFMQPFGANLSSSSARGSAYIVYDVDTVALQETSKDSDSVTFGWQFRPVLGEKSVAPGTRQVYVLLSLPVDSNTAYSPTITYQTYWCNYDTKAKIVTDSPVESSGKQTLPKLTIYTTPTYDQGLQPTVNDVRTFDAGNGRILVEATGTNFGDTTQVIVGGRTVDRSSGLLLKGGNMLSFIAPLSDIAYEDPLIVGQYGDTVPIKLKTHGDESDTSSSSDPADMAGYVTYKDTPFASPAVVEYAKAGDGISIPEGGIQIVPVDAQDSDLRITLVSRVPGQNNTVVPPYLPSNGELIISVGNQTFGLNDRPIGIEKPTPQEVTSGQTNGVTLDILVKNADLENAQKVTVRYAFCGDEYRADAGLPQKPFGDDVAVTLIGHNKKAMALAITGTLSSNLVADVAGEDYHAQVDPDQSYLLMVSADDLKRTGKSHAQAGPGSTMGKRSVQPYPVDQPLVRQKTYNLALLWAPIDKFTSQDNIVLYEPGAAPHVLSIKDCISEINKNQAPSGKKTASTLAPSAWFLLGSLNQGQSSVQSAGLTTAPSASSTTQPAAGTTSTPVTVEIVSQTSASTKGSQSSTPSTSKNTGKKKKHE